MPQSLTPQGLLEKLQKKLAFEDSYSQAVARTYLQLIMMAGGLIVASQAAKRLVHQRKETDYGDH